MIPRVPSIPQKNFSNWSPPDCLGVLEPASMTFPVGRTMVMPITKSLVAPYLRAFAPDELVATMPPRVATSLDAGPGMKYPRDFRAALKSSQTTPGSAMA